VIGHHPHVVQDTEVYRGRKIYYSLGNFVFDPSPQFLKDKGIRWSAMVVAELGRNHFVRSHMISLIISNRQPGLLTLPSKRKISANRT